MGLILIGFDFGIPCFNLCSGILSNFSICKNVFDIKWI